MKTNGSSVAGRICLVSGGDEIRYRSYVNHAVHAQLQGYSHHLGIGLAPGITSPYYYKFEVIRQVLHRYDWIVWLDDDVYITDIEADNLKSLVDEAERDDDFLIIAEGPAEPDGSWTRINTGVMVLRNDERTTQLIESALRLSLDHVREQWDESEEGLFTNGDQDTIWYAIKGSSELSQGVRIVGHRLLNSRPHYYEASLDDAFAVHFCGPGDKPLKVARFGQRFGRGQELVSTHLLDRYSVKRRETMPPSLMAMREVRWRGRQLLKRVRRKVDFVRTERRWK